PQAGYRTADEVYIRDVGDFDAVAAVAHPSRAVPVRADEVSEHVVAVGDVNRDIDAVAAVAGDHVAGAYGRAANGVHRGAIEDGDAAIVIAEGRRTAGVGADVVAGDDVRRGARAGDL